MAKAFIKAAIRARKDYKGSGNPTLFTTEDLLTEMLLLEDGSKVVIFVLVFEVSQEAEHLLVHSCYPENFSAMFSD